MTSKLQVFNRKRQQLPLLLKLGSALTTMSKSSGNLHRKLSQSGCRSRSRVRDGKVSRNPFMNFLADFRMSRKGIRMVELSKLAGREWRNMSNESKSPYLKMAQNAQKKKSAWKLTKRSGRRRSRSAGRPAANDRQDGQQNTKPTVAPDSDNKHLV